jgi:hypothetical protein
VTRWVVIAFALIAGIWLLGYDQRTDDTGVEVALIIALALALTVAAPRAALAIALGIGLPIAASAVWHGNYAGVMALLVAGAGALIGYAMRRVTAAPAR